MEADALRAGYVRHIFQQNVGHLAQQLAALALIDFLLFFVEQRDEIGVLPALVVAAGGGQPEQVVGGVRVKEVQPGALPVDIEVALLVCGEPCRALHRAQRQVDADFLPLLRDYRGVVRIRSDLAEGDGRLESIRVSRFG